MVSFGNILCVCLFISTIINVGVLALPEFKCKGQPIVMTDVQLSNLKECAKKVGIDSPEKITKETMGCFSKCTLEKKALVDEAGKPHKENINKLIDSTFPEIARESAKAAFGECLDQKAASLDAKDTTCTNYIPLAMCTQQAFIKICK